MKFRILFFLEFEKFAESDFQWSPICLVEKSEEVKEIKSESFLAAYKIGKKYYEDFGYNVIGGQEIK